MDSSTAAFAEDALSLAERRALGVAGQVPTPCPLLCSGVVSQSCFALHLHDQRSARHAVICCAETMTAEVMCCAAPCWYQSLLCVELSSAVLYRKVTCKPRGNPA